MLIVHVLAHLITHFSSNTYVQQKHSKTVRLSHSGTNHRDLPLPLGALVVPHQRGLTQLAGGQGGAAPLTLLVLPQSTGAITSTSGKTTK